MEFESSTLTTSLIHLKKDCNAGVLFSKFVESPVIFKKYHRGDYLVRVFPHGQLSRPRGDRWVWGSLWVTKYKILNYQKFEEKFVILSKIDGNYLFLS